MAAFRQPVPVAGVWRVAAMNSRGNMPDFDLITRRVAEEEVQEKKIYLEMKGLFHLTSRPSC